MTEIEAERVLRIMMGADGECYLCAARLAQEFIEAFPEHEVLAGQIYEDAYRCTIWQAIEDK